uniref:Serine carboxypeptidase n=1 Tax=Steinernema glaseri TaxID=37863 RepID=A0A1I8AT09_9BILA
MLGCVPLLAAVLLASFSLSRGDGNADRIVDLPGLTFHPNFTQYSGYLTIPSGRKLHYWLVESQNSPNEDPLVVWMSGRPGCSSLGGFLKEHGPFHPNPDGETLYENVFSWNKVLTLADLLSTAFVLEGSNVLYLEVTHDVGFSYGPPGLSNNDTWNDNSIAQDAVDALGAFLNLFPGFKTNELYIAGDSYIGGVVVPIATNLLIRKMSAGSFQLNGTLMGMIVGNGGFSKYQQLNSAIDLSYYRGILGRTNIPLFFLVIDGVSLDGLLN